MARGLTPHAAAEAWRRRARCASARLSPCAHHPRLTLVPAVRSYARLDSWLASHAVLKSATAPASPAQPPAPSAARVVAAPTTKLDAPVLSNGPAPPDLASTLSVPGGASHSAAASTPLRTTDVVVLYLLWLLSSVIFAALAWAQIHR